MNATLKGVSIGFLGVLTLVLVLIAVAAFAAPGITLAPGESVVITAQPNGSVNVIPTPIAVPPTVPAGVVIVALDWQNPQRVRSSATLLALEFTTGSTDSGFTLARIAGSEFDAGPSDMQGFFSISPCDEANKLGPTFGPSKSLTASFAIGSGSGFGFYPVLSLRTRYYLCVKTEGGNKFYDLSRWNLV